jgi:hypothetical protein
MAISEVPSDNPLNLPICRHCEILMSLSRIEPDLIRGDSSTYTFECGKCGDEVARSNQQI